MGWVIILPTGIAGVCQSNFPDQVDSTGGIRSRSIPMGLIYIMAGFLLGNHWLLAQTQIVEFTDGKSLPLANETGLLRIEQLVRDRNWVASAKQAVEIIEDGNSGLFLYRVDHGSRVFFDGKKRVQQLICSWGEKAPKALFAYRQLVDAEAEAMLKKANETQDLHRLKTVARKYFASRIGDEAVNQLAAIEFERGHFLEAAKLWDSLINHSRFPGHSILRYPDSNFPMLQLMTQSLSASMLAGEIDFAEKKLEFLGQEFQTARFDFLGRKGLSYEELLQEFEKEKQRFSGILNPGTDTWVDIGGRSAWNSKLKLQPKDQSPFFGMFPAVAEPGDSFLPTMVELSGPSVYWCDAHQIYQQSPAKGEASGSRGNLSTEEYSQKSISNDRKNDAADDKRTIWSTPFRRQLLPTARKQIGKPVFELELNSDFLFARMGSPLTSYRNDTITRNRSYLIGLDLRKQGQILPGFPIENDDPRIEFDATPVYRDGYLYLSRRKTFRDNATSKISIQCLELSRSNRTRKLRVVWERQMVSASTNNRGVWDEIARSKLVLVENRLIHLGLGFAVAFDCENGDTLWATDYFRDRFEFARRNDGDHYEPAPAVRAMDQVLVDRGLLFLAPSDSDCVYCLDVRDGHCHWKVEFSQVAHLLVAANDCLVASGHHLLWIDQKTGRLKSRFPTTPAETSRGFSIGKDRGIGKGAVYGGYIYWPTKNRVFVLNARLDRHQIPHLLRVYDLESRKTSGGNLAVGNGIMLIANEREINAYVE